MKIIIKESEKTICNNKNGLHKYFGWPSVARLQDGSLAMVASGFRLAHVCPFGKVILCRSYDEGKTWSAPEVIMDTYLDDRDAGIMTFGENGVIVTTFNNAIEFQREYQGNSEYRKGYLDEISLIPDSQKHLGSYMIVSSDGGKTFGDIKMLPISSPHGPCVLPDGKILYVGRLFHDSNSVSHIECHVIDAEGNSEFRSRIEDVSPDLLSCEPHAIALPDGKIVVHIRVQNESNTVFTIYQSLSTDNGYTFSKPQKLLSDKGGSPAHLLKHSSGKLISVYGHRERPYGIKAMFSDDDGESWDIDNIIIGDEPCADLGYPCSVELSNGDILTVLYAREPGEEYSVIRQVIWNFEK
jgi:hypothetical protein